MKTKEQWSLVDADLLFKFLTDPNIVKNLLNDTAGKPLETGNNTLNTNIAKPRVAPQHVTSAAMDIVHVPHIVPVLALSSVSAATDPPLSRPTQSSVSAATVFHTYPLSSGLKPLPRLEDSYTTAPLKPSTVEHVVVSQQKTVPKPQSQSPTLNISASSTWNMNSVPESGRTGTDPQISNGAYPMNINRDDQVSAKPVKSLEYFKNLIREHGGVIPATNETNNHKERVGNNMKVVKVKKVQKQCMFFGRGRGCKLGESCLYLHDRSKRLVTDVAAQFPRAKRLKFGT